MTQPQVVFLDEPTRGIDGRQNGRLSPDWQNGATGLAVMFSSSELDEVMALADRGFGDGRWPYYQGFNKCHAVTAKINRGLPNNTSRLIRLETHHEPEIYDSICTR